MAQVKNPIGWTEIYVEDLARAQKFYETVLDITMHPMPMPQGMDAEEGSENYFEMVGFPGDMAAAGSGGALVKSSMFKPGPGGTLNYFVCDDCAVELSRVEAAGGKVVAPKMSIGEFGFCAIAFDSEGNQIGFHSMA
ncbi:MAG: VOC family protein [Bacteroidota bacterium]